LKHPTARPAVSLFTTIPAGLNVAYWIPLQRESPSVLNKSGTYLTYFLTFFKQWMASPKKFYFGFGIRNLEAWLMIIIITALIVVTN